MWVKCPKGFRAKFTYPKVSKSIKAATNCESPCAWMSSKLKTILAQL